MILVTDFLHTTGHISTCPTARSSPSNMAISSLVSCQKYPLSQHPSHTIVYDCRHTLSKGNEYHSTHCISNTFDQQTSCHQSVTLVSHISTAPFAQFQFCTEPLLVSHSLIYIECPKHHPENFLMVWALHVILLAVTQCEQCSDYSSSGLSIPQESTETLCLDIRCPGLWQWQYTGPFPKLGNVNSDLPY